MAACVNERRLKRNHYVCDKGIAPYKMSVHKKLKLCHMCKYTLGFSAVCETEDTRLSNIPQLQSLAVRGSLKKCYMHGAATDGAAAVTDR